MLLFTPGPTPVLESVRVAMSEPTIHHRTPEFEAIFAKARESLLKLFDMPEAIILSSSGTGAMEACVVNLCHKKLLSINAGKFGERFGKIAKAHDLDLVELKYGWDTPADIDDILDAIEKNSDIDAVAIQISESAGGLRHPVEEIAKAIKSKREDILVIADGITAVGVESIDAKDIDALIAGSQKAFMLPPAMAMIGLSQRAVEKIGSGRGFYLNLASELKKQRQNTTAYTAPTTLVIGLNKMFEEVEKRGGFEQIYKETRARAKANQEALEAIGFKIYPKSPAPSMSAVFDESSNEIRKLLKEKYGVNIAGGQDHLKGKIFRINQMGIIEPHEAVWVVNALELVLEDLGRRAYTGEASRVFTQRYFKELSR
jgi:aspartate aminotransferase-like enzyme